MKKIIGIILAIIVIFSVSGQAMADFDNLVGITYELDPYVLDPADKLKGYEVHQEFADITNMGKGKLFTAFGNSQTFNWDLENVSNTFTANSLDKIYLSLVGEQYNDAHFYFMTTSPSTPVIDDSYFSNADAGFAAFSFAGNGAVKDKTAPGSYFNSLEVFSGAVAHGQLQAYVQSGNAYVNLGGLLDDSDNFDPTKTIDAYLWRYDGFDKGFVDENGNVPTASHIANILLSSLEVIGGSYHLKVDINEASTPEVPIPGSLALFTSGLIGLVGIHRRKKAL